MTLDDCPHWRLMVGWLAADHAPEPAPMPHRDVRWLRRRDKDTTGGMADLLQLVGDAEQAGERVSTARQSPTGICRRLTPSGLTMRHADALAILLTAESLGLLGRERYRDLRNSEREVWVLTPAGREHLFDAAEGDEC